MTTSKWYIRSAVEVTDLIRANRIRPPPRSSMARHSSLTRNERRTMILDELNPVLDVACRTDELMNLFLQNVPSLMKCMTSKPGPSAASCSQTGTDTRPAQSGVQREQVLRDMANIVTVVSPTFEVVQPTPSQLSSDDALVGCKICYKWGVRGCRRAEEDWWIGNVMRVATGEETKTGNYFVNEFADDWEGPLNLGTNSLWDHTGTVPATKHCWVLLQPAGLHHSIQSPVGIGPGREMRPGPPNQVRHAPAAGPMSRGRPTSDRPPVTSPSK